MYHRSLIDDVDGTPLLLRNRRRAKDVLPDTPADADDQGPGACTEEEDDDDSFIDKEEGELRRCQTLVIGRSCRSAVCNVRQS